jgi:Flp pilus assembly pilin Flp
MAWVSSIKNAIAERISEESGQDLIEYAVLAGAIGIVAAIAFVAFPIGGTVNTFATKVGDCLKLDASCK